MTKPTFIKIAADGSQLPADATQWDAVLLPEHGLMFSATSVVDTDVPQEPCIKACEELTLAGHSDWALPTIEQLQLLIDRTRYRPAIDTDYFRDIQNDWYWTSTPAAWSSASAWGADSDSGLVDNSPRSGGGFALAVRRAGQ